jgi:hypothetical protein
MYACSAGRKRLRVLHPKLFDNWGLIQFDPTHAGCLVCEQAHIQNLLLSGTVLSRAR